MDPANSIVWTRKSFIGSLVSSRVGFQQNLGQKSAVKDPIAVVSTISLSLNMQPHRHNKQESTTFILPYGSSKQHCIGKEEFHWLFGIVQGLVFSKTWVKNQRSDG
jgi:hypothetical protein